MSDFARPLRAATASPSSRAGPRLQIGHTALGLPLFVALLVVESARPPKRGTRH